MSDLFEKTLLDAIEKLQSKMAEAEQRILSDQDLIDKCSLQTETYKTLLAAYLEKKKADEKAFAEVIAEKKKEDAEALATLYTSGKTFADFKTFADRTGTELPAALEPIPDEDD